MQNTVVPHLHSFKDWLCHILYGLCIGAADVIPGFSGGTMALILGIYANFINAIKSFSTKEALAFFKLKLPTFFRGVSWDFLLAVLIGIICSIATLSQVIQYILQHETYRIYLYSLFLGMILASVVICIKHVHDWRRWHILSFMAGGIIAFLLSGNQTEELIRFDQARWFDFWLIFCGAAAVSAMLLPGVSGSYLLTILGAYPTVMDALADLVHGFKIFFFDIEAFLVLANLGIGIVLGAILFSRVISWLLHHYYTVTLTMLIGFMIGATPTIWPFWTYEYFIDPNKLAKGPKLYPMNAYMPSLSDPLLWKAVGVVILGLLVVLIIEKGLAAKKEKNSEHKKDNNSDISLFVNNNKLESAE